MRDDYFDLAVQLARTTTLLYTIACQADARLTETIRSRTNGKRDRWTMTAQDLHVPEIRDAYRAKQTADDAWLTYLRTSRARTFAPPVDLYDRPRCVWCSAVLPTTEEHDPYCSRECSVMADCEGKD